LLKGEEEYEKVEDNEEEREGAGEMRCGLCEDDLGAEGGDESFPSSEQRFFRSIKSLSQFLDSSLLRFFSLLLIQHKLSTTFSSSLVDPAARNVVIKSPLFTKNPPVGPK
jgi:hypothetical protein